MKKENKENYEIRKLFLENFTEALIFNMLPKESPLIPQTEKLEISRFKTNEEPQIAQTQQIQQIMPFIKSKNIPEIPAQIFKIPAKPIEPIKKQLPIYPQIPFLPPLQLSAMPISKLIPFLNDIAITTIECPGPERNIIINRRGLLQTTPIVLSQDEISLLMNEFSEKTRIPLIQGVFKAYLGNFLITAVVSEFVGTRFLIERRPQMYAPFPRR